MILYIEEDFLSSTELSKMFEALHPVMAHVGMPTKEQIELCSTDLDLKHIDFKNISSERLNILMNETFGNPYMMAQPQYLGSFISSELTEPKKPTTPNPRPLFGKDPNEVFNFKRKRG